MPVPVEAIQVDGGSELKAEFDGIITSIGAEVGQNIAGGQMVVRLARRLARGLELAERWRARAERLPARYPRFVRRQKGG